MAAVLCAGIAPLFLAARGGHLELVKGLLKSEAAVNFQGAQQNIGGRGCLLLLTIVHDFNTYFATVYRTGGPSITALTFVSLIYIYLLTLQLHCTGRHTRSGRT